MKYPLEFNQLLRTILLSWPTEIIFDSSKEQVVYLGKSSCTINGYAYLFEITEEIDVQYYGISEELLIRTLNSTIYSILRRSDLYDSKIKNNDFHYEIIGFSEAIKIKLENKLTFILNNDPYSLDWTDDNISVVNQYLELNRFKPSI
jgi:hypothetical protein